MPPGRPDALAEAGRAADREFERSSAHGAVQACRSSTWIDIVLVGEDDEPIPNERFEVYRPDGTLLGQGRLDENGCGGFEDIEDGQYEVCFPELDDSAWERA